MQRFVRFVAIVFVAAMVMASCGGDDDGSTAGDDPLDTSTSASDSTTTSLEPAEPELPEAEPSTYVGQNRIIHLAVLPDGTTPVLDIWARRSFEYAPILLHEGLEYGEVSDWYGRPAGMSVVAVESGSGPDADSFAEVFSAEDGERYSHLVVWDRERDSAAGLLLEDSAPGNSSEFPPAEPGAALVQLYAYQLRLNPLSEGESFDQTIAGVPTSFNVGIVGVAGCAPQRVSAGSSPLVLGGTQRVAFDLEPGTTSFTFHGWGSDDQGCLDDTLFGPLDVDVEADQRAWVLLHSIDGESIDALVVPLEPGE